MFISGSTIQDPKKSPAIGSEYGDGKFFFLILRHTQIDSSTIAGWQRRILHLVQLYSHVNSVNSVFVSDKIINNYDNFRIKSLSYNEISAILCSVFSVLTFLFFNLGKHVN